jgi:hypothetical protein
MMASEVGVVDVKPEEVAQKGRLRPGNILLVDFEKGIILEDSDMKVGLSELPTPSSYPFSYCRHLFARFQ